MKISTEISSAAKIVGEERAIALYAEAGFDAWDFSMGRMVSYNWTTGQAALTTHPLAGAEWRAFAQRLRRVGEDYGIH